MLGNLCFVYILNGKMKSYNVIVEVHLCCMHCIQSENKEEFRMSLLIVVM